MEQVKVCLGNTNRVVPLDKGKAINASGPFQERRQLREPGHVLTQSQRQLGEAVGVQGERHSRQVQQ